MSAAVSALGCVPSRELGMLQSPVCALRPMNCASCTSQIADKWRSLAQHKSGQQTLQHLFPCMAGMVCLKRLHRVGNSIRFQRDWGTHPLQKHGLTDNCIMRHNGYMHQQTTVLMPHRVRTVTMRQRQMRRPWHLQRAGSQTLLMLTLAAALAAGVCMTSSACLWESMAAKSSSSPSTGAFPTLELHHKALSFLCLPKIASTRMVCTDFVPSC